MPDRRTPPPPPPDPHAEVKARFGAENLEAILGTYRRFADKVDYRALVTWTMKQPVEDLLQPLFLAALVVITQELDLGSIAAELEAAQSAEAGQDALAESLAATVRGLDAHIERRADEIAGPRIEAAEMAGQQQVGEMAAELAALRQRKDDLIAELRRQLDAAVKWRDRQHAELKELRELRKRVVRNLVTCATGPDGVRYAPYSALAAAVWPEKTEDPT